MFGGAVPILEKQVLKRLQSLSDKQIMSVGSSLANINSLSETVFRSLRDEGTSRGRLLDANHASSTHSFNRLIDSVPVVFENSDMAILCKPAGMVVSLDEDLGANQERRKEIHRSVGGASPEFQYLLSMASPLPISRMPQFGFGILHRLDRETSGALFVAKRFEAFYDLRLQFACGKVLKEYTALALGWIDSLNEPVCIDSRISTVKKLSKNNAWNIASKISDDGNGMHALTEVTPVAHLIDPQTTARVTLIRARIHTGRSHQIRVHLASIGHPLMNDAKYGSRGVADERIFLHASRVEFLLPGNNSLTGIDSPLTDDFHQRIQGMQLVR